MRPHRLTLPLIAALLLANCGNDTDEAFLHPEECLVPIHLAVVEESPDTRSAVNSLSDISVSALGIYGVAEGSTTGTFPWTSSPLLSNAAPTGSSGNELLFASSLYYPAGGRKVIFYGYYPRTTATSGANYITPPANGTAPTFHFTLTGQEDIMHGTSPAGGTYSPGTAIPITFKHKLTQIQLNVSALGTLLSSIKILYVKTSGTMNLETGVVTYDSSTTDLTLTKSGLTTTAPVMVPADVPVYQLEVGLVGQLLPRKYVIKPTSGKFLEGILYTINL